MKKSILFKTDNNSLNLIEDDTKYLYDIGNTIGFRKDKKIYKFIGIRDGYDTQLEMSIRSLNIDGVERINKSRVNFSSVILNNDTGIVHDINSTKFLNILTENNYKNLLIINDYFNSFEIIYEIHTKGLKIKNELFDNKYIADNNYMFTFCNENSGYDKFIIDKPIMYDSIGTVYNFVIHSLYLEGDKLLYKKSIIKNKIKTNYPLYIDISLNFNITSPTLTENELNDNKIYGQTYKYIEPNEIFNLTAYTNITTTTTKVITWVYDINNPIEIGTGSTITLNSSNYNNNDKIYANVIDTTSGYSLCVNPLTVVLDISNRYNEITEKYSNIHPVDIDTVYWKFHRCISGVCFMYIRDTTNIYEQNELVCDTPLTGSYNMYSEYDIIDEFFSNSHEVEIAIDYNVDLTKNYKELDGVYMHTGTRVLLLKQLITSEVGIYEINKDFKLIRLLELDTLESMYRYKVHVNAGKYLDNEFHVHGYYNI